MTSCLSTILRSRTSAGEVDIPAYVSCLFDAPARHLKFPNQVHLTTIMSSLISTSDMDVHSYKRPVTKLTEAILLPLWTLWCRSAVSVAMMIVLPIWRRTWCHLRCPCH